MSRLVPGGSTTSGVSALFPLSRCGSVSEQPGFCQFTPHLSAGSALSVLAVSLQLLGDDARWGRPRFWGYLGTTCPWHLSQHKTQLLHGYKWI